MEDFRTRGTAVSTVATSEKNPASESAPFGEDTQQVLVTVASVRIASSKLDPKCAKQRKDE